MRKSNRKFISWLIVAALMVASVQTALAVVKDFGQFEAYCPSGDMLLSAPDSADSTQIPSDTGCPYQCTYMSQCQFALLRLLSSGQFPFMQFRDSSPRPRADTLVTRYPDRLKRPPKNLVSWIPSQQ